MHASIFFLTLSELVLIWIGTVLVANIRWASTTPATLGLIGVGLCATSLLIPLMARRDPTTTLAWRSIITANVYLILLWPILMIAH